MVGQARTAAGCGQYTDAETAFQYLRARYYDPATRQFLSRDPITAMTQAPYSYADNDPLNGTDPTGLFCILGHNPNGSCRGSNVKHDVAAAGAVAGVADLTISTAGIGDVVVAGVGLGTVGTVAAASSAGAAIAVAADDCRHDPGSAQCVMDTGAAALGTLGGGLSLAGSQLAGAAGEFAEFGRAMQIFGDGGLGVEALGLTLATLFGDQLGLTNAALCRAPAGASRRVT